MQLRIIPLSYYIIIHHNDNFTVTCKSCYLVDSVVSGGLDKQLLLSQQFQCSGYYLRLLLHLQKNHQTRKFKYRTFCNQTRIPAESAQSTAS